MAGYDSSGIDISSITRKNIDDSIIRSYFDEVDKNVKFVDLNTSAKKTSDADVRQIYVSVPTNYSLSIEVFNRQIIKAKMTGDAEFTDCCTNDKYSVFCDQLQKCINEGYVNNNEKIGDVPLIYSPPWANKTIENYWNLNPVDILSVTDKCIVVGGAGSGKSTLLKYITTSLIEQYSMNDSVFGDECLSDYFCSNKYVPIYIELRNLFFLAESQTVKSVTEKFIREYIVFTFFNNNPDAFRQFCDFVKQNDIGLFISFDGIDEIFNNETPKIANSLVSITEKLFSGIKTKLLFSSRKNGYDGWNLRGFLEVELKPMDKQCYLQLAEKIIEYNTPGGDTKQQVSMLDIAINDCNLDNDIVGSPLFMSLVVMIFLRNDSKLPERRSRIIDDSIKLLISRWSKKLKANEHYSYETQTLFELVRNVAYESLFNENSASDQKVTEIFIRNLREMVEKFQKEEDVSVDSSSIDNIINFLSSNAGIIAKLDDKNYRFTHRYFSEYLAASQLLENPAFDKTVFEKIRDNNYEFLQETLLLAVEILFDRENYPRVWQHFQFICYLYKVESTCNNRHVILWYLCRVFSARNYLLYDRIKKDCAMGADQIAETFKELIVSALKEFDFTPIQYYDCLVCLGVLGDSRPGVGIGDDGLPDIRYISVNSGEFIFGLSDKDKELLISSANVQWSQGFDVSRECPSVNLYVEKFAMSKYPITCQQYNLFIEDGGYSNEDYWNWSEVAHRFYLRNRHSITKYDRKKNTMPASNVTWIEAVSFCKWLTDKYRSIGKQVEVRLPTEVEWEYAAKQNGRLFSWGDEFREEKCNSILLGLNTLMPVGAFDCKSNVDNICDLNGNVWEWCYSEFTEDLSAYSTGNIQMIDLTTVTNNTQMVTRGGSFYNSPYLLRNSFRGRDKAGDEFNDDRQSFRIVIIHQEENL